MASTITFNAFYKTPSLLVPFTNFNLLDPRFQLNKFLSFSNIDFPVLKKNNWTEDFFLNSKTNVFNSSYTLEVQCSVFNSSLKGIKMQGTIAITYNLSFL